MQHLAAQQLESIQTMLSAGQRNLRIERASLCLWGGSFGGLILISNHILTAEQFPAPEQRALAWLLLLAATVAGVGFCDWHLTRHAKQSRDEAWSFLHRQVFKVWWLLLAVGVLLTFATFFYGGGYMIFAAWLVLVGLGLYIHGLFSEELLEWSGAMIIGIGICSLSFRLNYEVMQGVAASTLGLGLPLLALMLDRGRQRPFWMRLGQSLLWLLLVLSPPLLRQEFGTGRSIRDAPLTSVAQFRQDPLRRQIVALPPGGTIPVRVEVSGDLFRPSKDSVLPLVLNLPIEILMENGAATGDWRLPGEHWAMAGESHWITIPWIKAALTPESGPEIRAALVAELRRAPTN